MSEGDTPYAISTDDGQLLDRDGKGALPVISWHRCHMVCRKTLGALSDFKATNTDHLRTRLPLKTAPRTALHGSVPGHGATGCG